MRVDAIVSKAKKEVAPKDSKRITSGTIHHVHILDSSGSMDGGKYINAVAGINLDIKSIQESRKDFSELTETMSIIEFDYSHKIRTHYIMSPVESIGTFISKCFGGSTALYQAIGETIDQLLAKKKKEDKVVLKIFTDGGENASQGQYKNNSVLRQLISKVEEEDNFTVTFVGTEYDVKLITQKLSIDSSNTLVHDNTTLGVQRAFGQTVNSTKAYRKGVASGQDVSANFYSKTIEE